MTAAEPRQSRARSWPRPRRTVPTTSPRSSARIRNQKGSMMPIRWRTRRRSTRADGITAQFQVGEDRASSRSPASRWRAAPGRRATSARPGRPSRALPERTAIIAAPEAARRQTAMTRHQQQVARRRTARSCRCACGSWPTSACSAGGSGRRSVVKFIAVRSSRAACMARSAGPSSGRHSRLRTAAGECATRVGIRRTAAPAEAMPQQRIAGVLDCRLPSKHQIHARHHARQTTASSRTEWDPDCAAESLDGLPHEAGRGLGEIHAGDGALSAPVGDQQPRRAPAATRARPPIIAGRWKTDVRRPAPSMAPHAARTLPPLIQFCRRL